MIQFRCPECGKSVEVPETKSRRRVECPHCLENVLVPRLSKYDDPADSGLLPWLGAGITATGSSMLPGEDTEFDW